VRKGEGARPRHQLAAVPEVRNDCLDDNASSVAGFRSGNNAVLSPTWPLDTRNVGCGLALLRSIASNSIPFVHLDPEYRELLDQLKLGNEGVDRQRERAALPQMSEADIAGFGVEILRVLMDSAYCCRWTDKFALATGKAGIAGLKLVDWLTWDTQTFGFGYRTRHRGEVLVFLQKAPAFTRRKKGLVRPWRSMPSIPDVWCEKIQDRRHVHQKPAGLLRALIKAMTLPGDIVVDPAAGSFVTMDAAHAAGRRFLGTDLINMETYYGAA
jgi:site-specific DNA-methyltransferase (adenine-specific)